MQTVLAPHSLLSCREAGALLPLANTPRGKTVLTSAFVHKPSVGSSSIQSIRSTPYRCSGVRQRNVVCAAADVINDLAVKLPLVKSDKTSPEWTGTIYTTGELASNLPVLDFLDLELASEGGRVNAEAVKDLAKWDRGPWTSLDSRNLGQIYSGNVRVPKSIGRPTLALFKHKGGFNNPDSFYISRLVLTKSGEAPITFVVNSWIHEKQGLRVFFDDKSLLPSETPDVLKPFRAQELSTLRGPPKKSEKEPRTEWDRVYQWDVYNDLGSPTEVRPTLGGRKGPLKLAYPRRLRTGRGHVPGSDAENPLEKDDAEYWLPLDEQFDPLKKANFERGRSYYGLYALNGLLSIAAKDDSKGLPSNLKAVKEKTFPSFDAYDSLFKDREGVIERASDAIDGLIAKALPSLDKSKLGAALNKYKNALDSFVANAKKGNFSLTDDSSKIVSQLRIVIEKLTFNPPFVWDGREDLWRTDEEWGREALAGQNPCVIQAITSLPAGSSISAADCEAHMGGTTLAEAFASPTPRVFLVDYSVIYPEYTKKINNDERYQYAGRAILFLRDTQELVPVAIELFTGETPPVVYTPSDPYNVWLVAKHVFSSIDSGFHQLYSHFCRTHAVVEPACIAARRQLSALHPVYKLLMPHFRFTLNINRNARQTLVSQGGIIEKSFTPGPGSMTLSAEVYGRLWTFNSQSLPNDLVARGMAKKGADGKLEMLLPDYPYGSDGMLIWDAMTEWVGDYLSLYYTGEPGKSIQDDAEINAWWSDFVNEGHPDVTHGWPELKTVEDLTNILVTIIWLASGHHAAVNFGQYDYSGYSPNRSSIVHKPIPAKGTPDYQELVANLDKNFFKIFAGTKESLQVMATVALLSTHAENEQYINDKEHFYIFEKAARAKYDQHVARVTKIEGIIAERNADPHSVVRSPAKGGLPYKLLIPSSEPGVTGQGVPTSISI
eukprot:TRINITY_DN4898_c0_g1_i1.p1 TRINITY_DN4898_c0_g1~~TRINITY_DN4898_c0_g1_i1.p1  ORF type:complete len:946 (-),score=203.41 TRINITY_DN4898_c0_g1_i1:850-3687(-)